MQFEGYATIKLDILDIVWDSPWVLPLIHSFGGHRHLILDLDISHTYVRELAGPLYGAHRPLGAYLYAMTEIKGLPACI